MDARLLMSGMTHPVFIVGWVLAETVWLPVTQGGPGRPVSRCSEKWHRLDGSPEYVPIELPLVPDPGEIVHDWDATRVPARIAVAPLAGGPGTTGFRHRVHGWA